MNSLLEQVHVRQEIWKYRGTFDGYEKKWMAAPFKKLDINMISTKASDYRDSDVAILGLKIGKALA